MKLVLIGTVLASLGYDQPSSARHFETLSLLIKPGDLVFREGVGWRSAAVQARGNFSLSHVGIADRSFDGRIVIIHADPGGYSRSGVVRAESIESFAHWRQSRGLSVYRLPLSRRANNQMVATARSYVTRQIPFDYDFNFADDRALYCTELVWRALQRKRIPEFKTMVGLMDTTIIFPQDLLKSIADKKLIYRTD